MCSSVKIISCREISRGGRKGERKAFSLKVKWRLEGNCTRVHAGLHPGTAQRPHCERAPLLLCTDSPLHSWGDMTPVGGSGQLHAERLKSLYDAQNFKLLTTLWQFHSVNPTNNFGSKRFVFHFNSPGATVLFLSVHLQKQQFYWKNRTEQRKFSSLLHFLKTNNLNSLHYLFLKWHVIFWQVFFIIFVNSITTARVLQTFIDKIWYIW